MSTVNPSSKSALILDDDPFSRAVASEIIGSFNIRAVMAGDENEAIQLLYNSPFDIVFVDIQLGNTQGDKLCRIIRAIYQNAPSPLIVAMTGGGSEQAIKPECDSCFDATLYKPFDRSILLQLISSIIKKSVPSSECDISQQIAGLNTRVGLNLIAKDLENYKELLQRIPPYKDNFRETFLRALSQHDFAECQRLAHSLRGAMAFIGACVISAEAKRLERSCKRCAIPEINSTFEQVIDLLEILTKDVRENIAPL